MTPAAASETVIDILGGEGARKHGDAWKYRGHSYDLWKCFTHLCRWAWPFGCKREDHLGLSLSRLTLVYEREALRK